VGGANERIDLEMTGTVALKSACRLREVVSSRGTRATRRGAALGGASLALLVAPLLVTPCFSLDLSEVQTRGELRVLVTAGRPELFNWKPASLPGLERRILEGFASLLRVELAIVPARSRAALAPALLQGKADLAAGGIEVSPGRLSFSTEVLPNGYVVVTRRPKPVVSRLEELALERVGACDPRAGELLAEAGVTASVVGRSADTEAWLILLRNEEVGAFVVPLVRAAAARRHDSTLELGMFLGPSRSIAFAHRQEDVELGSKLSSYIRNLRRTSTWNRLLVTYFRDSASRILRTAQNK